MLYNFDSEIDRNGTGSVKWNFIKEKTGVADALPLWVADMDFPVANEIRDAIIARANHPLYGYTVRGDSYYRALTDWFLKRHDWHVDKEWITHSNGVINAIYTALQGLTKPGDGVIIQPPVYHPFPTVIKRSNRRVILNPLVVVDGIYRIDFDGLERIIDREKPKALLLCNPHNPVGRVFSRDELYRLGVLCSENGILVLSDEIHADLTFKGNIHIPFTNASPDSLNSSVIFTAPSKTFNLAGLSTSNIVIANPDLRALFDRANDSVGAKTYNLFGAVACEAAYAHGESWLEEVLVYLEENKRYSIEYIREHLPALGIFEPEGTYFLWIDLSSLGFTPGELEKFLLNQARLWVNQGYTFGEGGAGFVRINLACRKAVLIEALDRLSLAIRTNSSLKNRR